MTTICGNPVACNDAREVPGTFDITKFNATTATKFYVNVHTAAAPGGQARGYLQILDTGSPNTVVGLLTRAGVPSVTSASLGWGMIKLNADTASNKVSWVEFDNTNSLVPADTATAIHIHSATAIVLNLQQFAPMPTNRNPNINSTDTPATLNLDTLKKGDTYYANVHTPAFPAGAIAGFLKVLDPLPVAAPKANATASAVPYSGLALGLTAMGILLH
jgi:hypothetical protein